MHFRKTEVIYFCWDPLNAPIMLRRLAKSDFPRRGLPPPTEPPTADGPAPDISALAPQPSAPAAPEAPAKKRRMARWLRRR